jgi:hypothetical protein
VRTALLIVAVCGCQVLAQLDERELGPALDASAGAAGASGTGTGGLGGTLGGAAGSGGDVDAALDVGAGGSTTDASPEAPSGCPPPTTGSSWPDSTPACADGSAPPCAPEGQDADHFDAPPVLIDQGEVVADGVTGLLWEETPPAGAVTHAAALQHCAALAASGFGGASDWRLPTLMELFSIGDFATAPMAWLATGAGPFRFWTADWVWLPGPSQVFLVVDFATGKTSADPASVSHAAVCVSGALLQGGEVSSMPACSGVLADTRTGLEWQATAPGQSDWQGAVANCASLKELGGGWRLPNVKELVTLLLLPTSDNEQSSLPPQFANEPGGEYWSATPVYGAGPEAYFVTFGQGSGVEGVGTHHTDSGKAFRCVRP